MIGAAAALEPARGPTGQDHGTPDRPGPVAERVAGFGAPAPQTPPVLPKAPVAAKITDRPAAPLPPASLSGSRKVLGQPLPAGLDPAPPRALAEMPAQLGATPPPTQPASTKPVLAATLAPRPVAPLSPPGAPADPGSVHLADDPMVAGLPPQANLNPAPGPAGPTAPIAPAVAAQIAGAMVPQDRPPLADQLTEIALDPPELGRVRMVLSHGDAGMILSIMADRPETLELMRRNADLLAQEFADAGLSGTAFSFQGQDGQRPATPARTVALAGVPPTGPSADPIASPRRHDGALDLRV